MIHTVLTPTKILLKADWQGWLNSLKHQRETQRKLLLKLLGYLVFIVALSVLGNSIFRHLQLTDAHPTLVFSVINGFMMFGALIVAKELMENSLKIFYEAPDNALLRALPIQPVAIFGFKFVHLIATRFLSMLCFLGPPWVMFGLIFQLPWHFYAVLLPACLCLLSIIASYVTVGMMLIARFFSSGGLLSALKMLGTAIGVAVGFLLSLTLFAEFESTTVKQVFLNWASAETGHLANPLTNATWYPHQWMGKLMLSWVAAPGIQGSSVDERLWWGFLLIAGSLGSAGFATLVALQIYQRGWENIKQLKTKRKSARSAPSKLSFLVSTLGRGKMQAMMIKDFVVFIRHSGRFIAILMLTFFLGVHIGILLAQGSVADGNTGQVIAVQIVLYSLLISFGLSCSGFREEAKTWWMLQSAPVTPQLMFTSKFLTALLCAFIYAEFWMLIGIKLLQIPVDTWMPILLIPIPTLTAASALNTAIGTLPWMAELSHEPKPLLRVLTFMFTFIADIALVIAPMMTWHLGGVAWFGVLMIFLAGVFAGAYKLGIGNLRKLLVAPH